MFAFGILSAKIVKKVTIKTFYFFSFSVKRRASAHPYMVGQKSVPWRLYDRKQQ